MAAPQLPNAAKKLALEDIDNKTFDYVIIGGRLIFVSQQRL